MSQCDAVRTHLSLLRCSLEILRPIIVAKMPSVTIKSLQKESNPLKDEIAALRINFDRFQQFVNTSEVQGANNGGNTCLIDAETSTHLEFYGKWYDSLIKFQEEAKRKFNQLWSCLGWLPRWKKFQAFSISFHVTVISITLRFLVFLKLIPANQLLQSLPCA